MLTNTNFKFDVPYQLLTIKLRPLVSEFITATSKLQQQICRYRFFFTQLTYDVIQRHFAGGILCKTNTQNLDKCSIDIPVCIRVTTSLFPLPSLSLVRGPEIFYNDHSHHILIGRHHRRPTRIGMIDILENIFTHRVMQYIPGYNPEINGNISNRAIQPHGHCGANIADVSKKGDTGNQPCRYVKNAGEYLTKCMQRMQHRFCMK